MSTEQPKESDVYEQMATVANLPVIKPAKKEKLTPKQAKFIIEYLIDLNATQAAIRSGYSPESAAESGCENLMKSNIQQAIQEQMNYRTERTLITADYVLASMKELAERCLQRKPVMTFNYEEKCLEQETVLVEQEDGTAKSEGVWEFDSAGANRALENLARNQKLLTDKVDLGGHDGGPLQTPVIKRIYVKSTEEAAEEIAQSQPEQNAQ